MIFFPTPIITPSTKAEADMMRIFQQEEIIEKDLATEDEWEQLTGRYALQLFERGKEIAAARRGLILVDTKYEFGKIGDTIYLMDEIHTPDSVPDIFMQMVLRKDRKR